MENEIKVGEYVRCIHGSIGKVTKIEDEMYLYEDKELICHIKNIVKHSKDIIDILEWGDYVNGHKVVNEIWGEDDNNLYFEIEGGFNKAKYIGEKDIKSIVTKEMMESISYKVERKD